MLDSISYGQLCGSGPGLSGALKSQEGNGEGRAAWPSPLGEGRYVISYFTSLSLMSTHTL